MKTLINGRSFSGKDTVADILCQRYGYQRDSFAAPIYDIARELFDMKEKDRELLIDIGQKLREINPDVWINALLKRNRDATGDIVVTDVRQANEYIRLKAEGYVPIRVKSSLEKRIERCRQRDGFEPTKETIALWESEGEVGADDFEYYEIENNGTYDELVEKVDEFIRKHR